MVLTAFCVAEDQRPGSSDHQCADHTIITLDHWSSYTSLICGLLLPLGRRLFGEELEWIVGLKRHSSMQRHSVLITIPYFAVLTVKVYTCSPYD